VSKPRLTAKNQVETEILIFDVDGVLVDVTESYGPGDKYVRDLLKVSQFPDGHWPTNWPFSTTIGSAVSHLGSVRSLQRC
jgi:phosphoglycolate phosphatase-like HAD superfamily hydrolase